jgi:hypothetical protein
MDIEEKNEQIIDIKEEEQIINSNGPNQTTEAIIDLPKLSNQSEIKNSDIILAILEICIYNKKYNYDCSNNTKAFWDRVVGEEILQKIFKNFKSETLRKYWKIIRMAGNNSKFIETVKHYEKFINNPVFKLLPIINAISSFVQTEEKNFENYFLLYNSKEKKALIQKLEKQENKNINLIGNKRNLENDSSEKMISVKKRQNSNNKEKNEVMMKDEQKKKEEKKEYIDPKVSKLDELVNKLMEISKFSREEVVDALYGTSNNIENAYKYLQDNEKYEKYYFVQTDDYIIKNLRNKGYYIDLINEKGEELVKEREKFLGIN